MSMFRITQNKGFQMTFENGCTISVQFGYRNYCDNNNHPDGYDFSNGKTMVESSDAEIAIILPNGEFYDITGIQLMENKLIGNRESHRLIITIDKEKWTMGRVIGKV